MTQKTRQARRAARDAAIGAQSVLAGSIRVPMIFMGGDTDRFIPIGVTTRVVFSRSRTCDSGAKSESVGSTS